MVTYKRRNIVIVRIANWYMGMLYRGIKLHSRYYILWETKNRRYYETIGWVWSPDEVRRFAAKLKRVSRVYIRDIVLPEQKLLPYYKVLKNRRIKNKKILDNPFYVG